MQLAGVGAETLALVILKGRDSVKTLVLVIQILPQFRLPTTTSGVEMQLGVPQFDTWILLRPLQESFALPLSLSAL